MTDTASTAADRYPEGYPKIFWVALFVGWVVIGIGVRGVLINEDARMGTNPPGWALLMVKSNLAHDFVLVPLVLAVGVLVARVVSARIRSAVQFGLIVTGIVLLYAFPFIRGYGRSPNTPTILPQDYARGTLLVLGAVWFVTALLALAQWRRSREGQGAHARGDG